MAAILALLYLGLVWSGRPPDAVQRPVIAVLPFVNMGPGEDIPAISDALGDNIITSLARYSQFDVIARQSSFRFKDENRDLREIGKLLGADYIVQGSLGMSDRRLRISVQLVDAGEGTLRMVDAVEIPAEDALKTNDNIVRRIANTIGGSVMEAHARAPRRPGEIDALILDNRSRLLFQSGPSREKWLSAIALQTQAIDPLPGVLTLWVRAWGQWQMGECEDARSTVETIPSAPLEMNKLRAVIYVCAEDNEAAAIALAEYLDKRPDWSIAREIEANAANWVTDGPRDRWLDALAAAGLTQ